MKTTIFGILVGTFISIVCGIAVAQAEIKVGIAEAFRGSIEGATYQQEIGALKAIDHLNAKGGLLGEKIVAISAQDSCDPRQAKEVAQQLVSSDVIFVVGHVCSSCSITVCKTYEKAGIVMISPCSTNPKVTDEGGPNVFRVIGRDDQQGTIAGDYLADNHGKSNIAIIHDGDTYGMGLAEFTRRQLNKRGITEVMFENYKEVQGIVDKLANKKIDVLYAGGMASDIGNLIPQMSQKK